MTCLLELDHAPSNYMLAHMLIMLQYTNSIISVKIITVVKCDSNRIVKASLNLVVHDLCMLNHNTCIDDLRNSIHVID